VSAQPLPHQLCPLGHWAGVSTPLLSALESALSGPGEASTLFFSALESASSDPGVPLQ
jgi:hypothetical protein